MKEKPKSRRIWQAKRTAILRAYSATVIPDPQQVEISTIRSERRIVESGTDIFSFRTPVYYVASRGDISSKGLSVQQALKNLRIIEMRGFLCV